MQKIKPTLPGLCDLGDVPDYLASVYADVTDNIFPDFLRSITQKYKYMVIGGRASNIYSKIKTPSADWDIVVEFKGSESEQVSAATIFVNLIENYVSGKLPKNWSGIVGVNFESKDFGGHFLFQVGIIDPYSDRDIKFVDIHMCHNSSISGVGNYCDYISNSKIHDGIYYAPKLFLDKELKGVVENRKKLSHNTLLSLEDFSKDREKLSGIIVDLIEDIVDITENEKTLDENKTKKVKKLTSKLNENFEEYLQYCDHEIRTKMLAYKENIKYERTKARFDNR
jgi:hypothetical protein